MQPSPLGDPSEWPTGNSLVLSGFDSSWHGATGSLVLLGTRVECNQKLKEARSHFDSWAIREDFIHAKIFYSEIPSSCYNIESFRGQELCSADLRGPSPWHGAKVGA